MSLNRRRFLTLSFGTIGASLLTGCGFRPLYGRRGYDTAAQDLASIEIDPVADRLDQILRNDLIARLTPFGEPADARYRLRIKTSQSSSALAIQSNSTITRFNLSVIATFALFDSVSNETLFSGNARAVGSYDAVRSDFATLTAEQDSARRTVGEVSEDVRAQIAAFFARRQSGIE